MKGIASMMKHLAGLFLLLGSAAAAADVKLDVHPDRESGVYSPGEKVTWTVKAAPGSGAASGKIEWVVKRGGLKEQAKGNAEFVDGVARVTATRPDPGSLLLEVRMGKTVVRGGAVFAPGKIAASAPPPKDFDAFWKGKLEELAAVPMNVTLTPVDVGDASVEYFKITMDNIRGSRIHGQLAKPAGKSSLSGLLQVQWAGIYPLHRDWVLGHARNGWLSLNIIAHDLPIDEPAAFYQAKGKAELKGYPSIGSDDREKSYFLRMFLSCHRAVEYLTTRPDWNRKALVVHGGSQGGYQAIVSAGIHPAVTAIAANVPAGCDHTGRDAERESGWPRWTVWGAGGKDPAKVKQAARYFDAMNFARRVKVPALVGIGLVDTVCPAEGVFATVNQFTGPKKLIIMPRSGHGGEGPGHKAYYAVFGGFLDGQRAGGGK